MIGLSVCINRSWSHAFALRITLPIFLITSFWESLDGFGRSFPLYFLKFHPKKLKPSLILVTRVFSSLSLSPRGSKNPWMALMILWAVSNESAVTTRWVAQGNFTPRPSQHRTWTSQLIRLLLSNPRMKEPPVSKQPHLTRRNVAEPVERFALVSPETLVFPGGPSGQDAINRA